jgi:hypothetical protein
MKTNPRIGAYVLETLTTGMYVQALDTIRELVQNAADSVREAEESGVLGRKAGRIEIDIGPNQRSLKLSDNGIGVRTEDAGDRLLNVGMSEKDVDRDAGFRGIGRLAAIGFCDCLKFRGSCKGEPLATTIEFDCVGIKKAISPRNRSRHEMAEVLAKYSSVSTEPCPAPSHFFEVHMQDVDDATKDLLDPSALETYLSQVAPVDFDPHDFLFAPKIQRWVRENKIALPTVSLMIKADSLVREVFKPYRNRYKTAHQRDAQYDVDVQDVDFSPEKLSGEPRFWIWFGVSELPGTIGDERVAGFRLRKKNIALGGPERVAELFREVSATYGRFNAYYIGEIHVLCADAVPNARRDGFENTGSWPRIHNELIAFIRERCASAYKASSARNLPAQKLRTSAEKTIRKAETTISSGFASIDERDKLVAEVQKEREKVQEWGQQRGKADITRVIVPLVKKLQAVEGELRNDKHFLLKKVDPSLDRKQRRLLQEVVRIIQATLEAQSCKKASECTQAVREAISRKFGTS